MALTKSIKEIIAEDTSGLLNKHASWERVCLRDVAAVLNGYPFESRLFDAASGMPLIRIRDVLVGQTDTFYRGAYELSFVVEAGDLLIGMDGDFHCARWRSHPGLLNQRVCKITPHTERYNPRLLEMVLPGFLSAINAATSSVTVKHLSSRSIEEIELPLPPAAEQTRIVEKLEELLSDLDAGVAELKAAQQKLTQYRQSLLKAAVEGVLTADWRGQRTVATPSPRGGGTGRGYRLNAPSPLGHHPLPNPPSQGEGTCESGAQLLERILKERRARWQAKQLAKFKEQGKAPPKDWQDKYPEPVKPDTTDLPPLPQGWVWASVDQLSESVRNGLSKTPNTDGRGFPIFKINAVRPMTVSFTAIKHIEIDETEAADYWVETGDVLATRYNGSVDLLGVFGMVKTVPQRTLHPDKLIRMKPLLGVQLGAWLEVCGNVGESQKHLVSKVKTTAGQTGISGEDLKKTPIPLPPFAEQEEVLAGVDERLQTARELELPLELSHKQSTAQRKNILKAAFSGQLVPQDPNDEPASVLLARIRAERAVLASKPRVGRRKAALADVI